MVVEPKRVVRKPRARDRESRLQRKNIRRARRTGYDWDDTDHRKEEFVGQKVLPEGGRFPTYWMGTVAIDGSLKEVPGRYLATRYGIAQLCFNRECESKCGRIWHSNSNMGMQRSHFLKGVRYVREGKPRCRAPYSQTTWLVCSAWTEEERTCTSDRNPAVLYQSRRASSLCVMSNA